MSERLGRQSNKPGTATYLRNLARMLDVRADHGADFRHWVLAPPIIKKRWAIVLIRETRHVDATIAARDDLAMIQPTATADTTPPQGEQQTMPTYQINYSEVVVYRTTVTAPNEEEARERFFDDFDGLDHVEIDTTSLEIDTVREMSDR